ncbi:MAG: hypothetical protein IKO72_06230 [Kiritimatiellae bacterium]|nr:hypothetical protein [Kiritimatiellia bacterium]
MKFQTIPAWNARKHVVKIAAALVFILGMDGWVLAAHPDVTDFDSGLVVTEDTTFSGVTNRYDRIGNKIHANLTLENYSYVRIQGHATIQGTIPMGPVDSSAVNQCPVVTIKSNCGFYASYRNTPGFLDEEDSNVKRTSQTFVLGQNGGSGRFLVQAKGNNFGANVDNVSLWIERLVVSPNATTDGDRFDILQLDQNGNADITCIVNENAKPARIVFNGGWLRNSYMNGAGFQLSPAEGCVLELEAINWNDIKIVKAFLSSTLNGGKGTVRFKGKCNIVIQEKGGNLPGIGNSNRMPYYLAATNSPIEWKQTGNLVLDSNAFITCMDDDQLPYKAETGIVRLQSNAILDPNGTSQKLRSLIATSSSALVTNAMARHEGNTVTSTLVFGADDQDGVFSATCCDNVNVEKIGSGTLVVSNVTVRGTFTVSAGRVVFVGNNVFENPVVYADGVEVVTPPTSPNPIVNLCDDARIPAGTGAYRYMYVKEDAGTTYAYAGDYLDGLDIDIRSGTLKFTGITTDKWWRFTFKAAADVTQSSTGAVTRAELGTISLMATNAASFAYKDDKCLSLGLQTNNVQPSS